jgi:alpha-L-rhamnosidase
MSENTAWKASWIWSEGEESPRNEWRCFRKTFHLNPETIKQATIQITADSRYVLYVNGQQEGRGPVRSWPFELSYDVYEIGHLLKPGAVNTIAILVMHFGISTFYYLRGRGGLLAQVELETVLIVTDATWMTAIHEGHDSDSSRMSCQHSFTEIIDARVWDEKWTTSDFNASGWKPAVVIGPAGMKPWVKLVERDIPHLTEELTYPIRIESLSAVKPRSWGVVIDLRNHFDPESANHANNVSFSGYLCTVIKVEKPVRATIGIVDGGRIFGPCSVNGIWYDQDAFFGEEPEHYLEVDLRQGENLFLMDVSGTSHGHGFHIGMDCDEPFKLESPVTVDLATSIDASPFVTIGPFNSVDSQSEFIRVKQIEKAADLAQFYPWVKSVSGHLVNSEDVFSMCVWKKQSVSKSVPFSLQNAVISNQEAAVVPLYPDADTEIIIDFGRELSGYLVFEVEASAGTIIDFYGFEYMKDGWRQETYELDNTLRYVCREGRQTYSSPVRRGLRYLMVTVRGADSCLKIYNAALLQSNYPVAEIGQFQCSDPLLNDIWQISKHTTRLCMEDTFVDCPAYEQTFWVGDARNEALVNYYLFGDEAIVKRCLRLVPGSKFQSPLFANQVPSGWNSVIPNWTFFWVIACLELFQYNGESEFAEEIWTDVKYTLDHYLEFLDERGLLNIQSWNLLDWAPIDQPNDGVVAHQNMFFVKALRSAAQLAAGIDNETAPRYTSCANQLRDAINAFLWSENRQAFLDCIHADGHMSETFSMQTQVVAYLCDIADGPRLNHLINYVVAPPKEFVQIGSPFMSFFHYEALTKLGRVKDMLEDMRKNYGQMIDHGATTCWEMYPSFSENRANPNLLTRSHCHAWSAGPGYFLGAYVLGVRGLNPGWSKVLIEPQPAGLAWARGTVPIPGGGRIDVSWSVDQSNRKLQIRVAAPSGIELSITPPPEYEADIQTVYWDDRN